MSIQKKLIFSAVTVVLVFGLLEGIARVALRIYDPFDRVDRFWVRDPVLHHTWIPSVSGVATTEDTHFVLHINRQSWVEEYDVQQRKPPGVFRVFMVGDSNTQGFVDTSNKWVKIVERGLNQRARQDGGAETTYEVINAGRWSYSPLLYYLHIKNQILPYSPDLVVINVDMTDCRDDTVYRYSMQTNSAGDVVAVNPSRTTVEQQGLVLTPRGVRKLTFWERDCHWLLEHFACLAYLHLAILQTVDRESWIHNGREAVSEALAPNTNELPKRLQCNWLAHTWNKEVEENVAFTMMMLGKSIDLLKSNGVACMVTGVPHYLQFTGYWSARPHEVLADTARQHGVPFLNVYEVFYPQVAHSKQSDFYWPGDPIHLNARGNQMFADAFLSFWDHEKTNFLAAAAHRP